MTIFVSVASYRDPELVPTVRDLLATAARPERLRVVVCWQHLGDEDVRAIAGDPRVELIERDARDSRGACWARAQIFDRYDGENWLLQIDSHTRMTPGWDERLPELAARTGAGKPILTGYPSTYEPGVAHASTGQPTMITLAGWTGDGLPMQAQEALPDTSVGGAPVPARFVAAGFLFAPGTFAQEVPYDPNIYFLGEEITLAVRAFTWGYDLFHPAEVLSWHYYIRAERPRHWTDHVSTSSRRDWPTLDRASRRRVTNLLRYPSAGRLAVGPHRTVGDYEAYAGLSFRSGSGELATWPGQLPVPVRHSV